MQPKFKFETHEKDGRKRHVWSLVGPSGGVHIWAQMHRPDDRASFAFGETCYGGVEVHYPHKPYEHSPDEAPIKDCWLTGCECWPDGSSLYFSENLAPMLETTDDPARLTEYMNSELLSWYRNNLSRSDFSQPEPEFLHDDWSADD